LSGNELIEIGVGEPEARPFLAVADDDVAERASIDVTHERLDGTAELRCGFGGRAQPIGRARLALAARLGWRRIRCGRRLALGSGLRCCPELLPNLAKPRRRRRQFVVEMKIDKARIGDEPVEHNHLQHIFFANRHADHRLVRAARCRQRARAEARVAADGPEPRPAAAGAAAPARERSRRSGGS
jgi:hypothetical protein